MRWRARRERFRAILSGNTCLHPASVFDPLSARIAEHLGFEFAMMAGSTASLSVLGAPDLVLLTASELVRQAQRVCRAMSLPLAGRRRSWLRQRPECRPHDRGTGDRRRRGGDDRGYEPAADLRQQRKSHTDLDRGRRRQDARGAGGASRSGLRRHRTYQRAEHFQHRRYRGAARRLRKSRHRRAVHRRPEKPGRPCSGQRCDHIAADPRQCGGDLASADLAAHRVRISLQGHAPIMAAVQAVYDTMKALREGTKPGELKNVAPNALMNTLTRAAAYDEATKLSVTMSAAQPPLNFLASASAFLASRPTSAPTATNSVAPLDIASGLLLVAGEDAGGLADLLEPLDRVLDRRLHLGMPRLPMWPNEADRSDGPMNTPSTPSTEAIASICVERLAGLDLHQHADLVVGLLQIVLHAAVAAGARAPTGDAAHALRRIARRTRPRAWPPRRSARNGNSSVCAPMSRQRLISTMSFQAGRTIGDAVPPAPPAAARAGRGLRSANARCRAGASRSRNRRRSRPRCCCTGCTTGRSAACRRRWRA